MPRVYTATRSAHAPPCTVARVAKIAQEIGRETAAEMVNLEELVKMGYLETNGQDNDTYYHN